MNTIKKWLYPLIFSLFCLLFFSVPFYVGFREAGLAIAIFALGLMALLVLIAIPVYCVLYSRKTLASEKRKYVFAIYNVLLITVSFWLPYCTETESYILAFIVFGWVSVWSIVPLLIHKKSN